MYGSHSNYDFISRTHNRVPEFTNTRPIGQHKNYVQENNPNLMNYDSAHLNQSPMVFNKATNTWEYYDPGVPSGLTSPPPGWFESPMPQQHASSTSSLNNALPYSGRYNNASPFPDTYRHSNYNTNSLVRTSPGSSIYNDQISNEPRNELIPLSLPKHEFTGWAGYNWPTVLKTPKVPDPEEENMRVYTKPSTSHNRTYCFEFIKKALKKYTSRLKQLIFKHFPNGFHIKSGHLESNVGESEPNNHHGN